MDLEKKEYIIQGQKFFIKKVLIIQLEMISDVLGELDFGQNFEKLSQVIKMIRKKGIKNFMEIVFYKQPVDEIDWGTVEFEIMDEIIEDFFVLNPRLKRRVMQFLNNFLPQFVSILIAYKRNSESN